MKDTLLWLALALIWSASYGAIKIGLNGFGPMTLVAGRMCIASLILLSVLKFKSQKLGLSKNACTTFLISGLLGSAIPFFLIGFGEASIDSGLAAVTMGIAPIATVMFAPFLLTDEHLTLSKIIGSLLGVAGLVVLFGVDVFSHLGQNNIAQIAIIAAALCYAATTLYVRRYVSIAPLQMATGATLVGAVVITTCAFIFENPFQHRTLPATSLGAMVYLGVMATATANLLYFYLVPRLGAGRMSQINFLVPAFGAIIGLVFLNEPYHHSLLVALGLIMAAVALVSRKA